MKTLLTITFLFLFSNACGSIDDEKGADPGTPSGSVMQVSTPKGEEPVKTDSATSGKEMCKTTVSCLNQCSGDKSCTKQCLQGLSGQQIAKADIYRQCLEYDAYQCVTESCEQKECFYAVDICAGEKKYGCAQMVECSRACYSERCYRECFLLGTESATQLVKDINKCVEDFCSDSADVDACARSECAGELTACTVN